MKTSGIAALASALLLCAAAARAQAEAAAPGTDADESPYGNPYYEEVTRPEIQPETRPVPREEVNESREDQDISTARREEKREIMKETPNRMEPFRVFPGELPVKSTTSGSLDFSGRVIQDNRTNSAPPSGTVDPGSLDAVHHDDD